MFGYRSGKYPVTAKALQKLEKAETAAGAPFERTQSLRITSQNSPHFAEYAGNVKHHSEKKSLISPSRLEEIFAAVAGLQHELAAMTQAAQESAPPFTMAALISYMQQASAWPPTADDGALSPTLLWKKYGPQT